MFFKKLTYKEINSLTMEDVKKLNDKQINKTFILQQALSNFIKHYAKCFIPDYKHIYKNKHTKTNVKLEYDLIKNDFHKYFNQYWKHLIYWQKKRKTRYIASVIGKSYIKYHRFILICHLNRYNKLGYVLTKLYWLSSVTGQKFIFMKKSHLFKMYGRTQNKYVKELLSTNQLFLKFETMDQLSYFINQTYKLKINPAIIYPICIADLYQGYLTPLKFFNIQLKTPLTKEQLKHIYLENLLKKIIKNFRENTDKWIDKLLSSIFL